MRADFIGTGWSYPLGVRSNGTIAVADGTSKLEQAMHIILTTYPGERPMRPEFGSRLRDYIFEGATDENSGQISTVVTQALQRWEPRVDVQNVVVTPITEVSGLLHIEIFYLVRATNDERNLVFPFYTIPTGEEEEVA
jgi:phage baseplate assembly protein W